MNKFDGKKKYTSPVRVQSRLWYRRICGNYKGIRLNVYVYMNDDDG